MGLLLTGTLDSALLATTTGAGDVARDASIVRAVVAAGGGTTTAVWGFTGSGALANASLAALLVTAEVKVVVFIGLAGAVIGVDTAIATWGGALVAFASVAV